MKRHIHLLLGLSWVFFWLVIPVCGYSQYTYHEGWIEEFSKAQMVFLQDQNGYIWGNDIEKGGVLFRFDGFEYQYYPVDLKNKDMPSGSSWAPHSIYVDRENQVWVGALGSNLNKYNPQTGKFIRYAGILQNISKTPPRSIIHITEDSLGDIWLGTQSGLIHYSKHTDSFAYYEREWIQFLCEGSNGNIIYFGESSFSLWEFDRSNQDFHQLADLSQLQISPIPSAGDFGHSFFKFEGRDQFLIPGVKGLIWYDLNTGEHVVHNAGYLKGEHITCIAKLGSFIGVGTSAGRVFLYPYHDFSVKQKPQVIHSNVGPVVEHLFWTIEV